MRTHTLRVVAILAVLALAVPLFAQKGTESELGFQPDKLYHFTDIDSVNLFNGNLTMSVPLGPVYRVGPSLSYQFTLTYNSKVWDFETYDYTSGRHTDMIPNRRSNAGIGWRLSFGRLLPPTDASLDHSTDDRDMWVYESPAGDEHPFADATLTSAAIAQDASALRFVYIDGSTRDIEFPSGEKHRFTWVSGVGWRLYQMSDRFGNWVRFAYQWTGTRPETITVTDSLDRTNSFHSDYSSAMGETVDGGAVLGWLKVQGTGGVDAQYDFIYETRSVFLSRDGHPAQWVSVPVLTEIKLPDWTLANQSDRSEFVLDYTNALQVKSIQFPTGGKVDYTYATYLLGSHDLCSNIGTTPYDSAGVRTRTISDRVGTSQTWDYLQRRGPGAPLTFPDPNGDYCCTTSPPSGQGVEPIYWCRTSVLSPSDANGKRTRTDNYFDIFDMTFAALEGGGCPSPIPNGMPYLTSPLPGLSSAQFGYPGTPGRPPQAWANGDPLSSATVSDITALDSGGGLLTSQVFTDCASSGDCSVGGKLMRSTYTIYEPHPLATGPCVYPNAGCTGEKAMQLKASRTYFEDDGTCPSSCYYTDVTSSNVNSVGLYTTVTESSNFPSSTTRTTVTSYKPWTSAQMTNPGLPWITGVFTEKKRTEGNSVMRSQYCFDESTGFLKRQRQIADTSPAAASGPTDLLTVYQATAHGDAGFVFNYGGETQALSPGTDLCSLTLPSAAWYQVENSYDGYGWTLNQSTHEVSENTGMPLQYKGGVLVWSRYYDRNTGQPLSFRAADRIVDRTTGLVVAARDTAGVKTSYEYDAKPSRLIHMRTPAGAVTDYTYTNAGTGSTFTPALVDVSTNNDALGSQFVFDGIGRVIRRSHKGPNEWVGSQTAYDWDGRVLSVSEAEGLGSSRPAGGPLTAAFLTSNSYDGLGRPKSVTVPDGSTTTYTYVGERQKTRTAKIFTGGALDSAVSMTEEYDGFGRLQTVTQKSGPTSAVATTGADVKTSYTYDAGSHLTSVRMSRADGSGPVQNRAFDYDGRGLLRWESQPESGMTSYTYDAKGHVVSKLQSGGNTQFDLTYDYDSAERLLKVYGRNPLYSADPAADQPLFHAIKEFVYGAQNASVQNGTNYLQGKLVTAIRHNYGETATEPEYKVEDTYGYIDVAGRKTNKTTAVSQVRHGVGGWTTVLESLDQSVAYDALDQQTTISYPMCLDCGAPPTDPTRSGMTRGYTGGRLTSLSDVASSISYWPDGLRHVLTHTNGIADTQTIDKMPRPSRLQFGTYDRCVRPSFVTQPASAPMSGTGVTLSVNMNGTGPFTYTWYEIVHNTNVGSTQSIIVSPTVTTSYYVVVSNPCGYEESQIAKVTVNECPAPSTGFIQAVAQPDGTWILTPNPVARQPRTYSWKRLSDNALLGTAEKQPIGQLSMTTTYQLTITDACGSGTGNVTVNVPLPITNGLQATASLSPLYVQVTWPAIAGATQYTVERRSLGGAWETAGTTNAPTVLFVDGNVAASRTYVYRVTADNGGKTNYDLATTMSFTQANAGGPISATPMNSMLDAVNKVREAAGWTAVTWSTILAGNDPLPVPGQLVTARQLIACRARMNEALQALGVSVGDYTDPDLFHLTIRASYINEVEARAR